ncbi:unnamed protein product [Arabidopsis halleri]
MTIQISPTRQQALPRTPDTAYQLYPSRHHYNLATTMMTMKSHIKNPTVQTTVFGQSVGKGPTKEPRVLGGRAHIKLVTRAVSSGASG